MSGPDDQPQFTEVGRLVDDHIVWHDGRPPTPWPQLTPTAVSPGVEGGTGTNEEEDRG